VLRLILRIPRVLGGLLSIILGLSIIGWVLYNSFVETQPEYSGGFLTFGIGPTLVLVGAYWLRTAFTRGIVDDNDQTFEQD